MKKVIRISLIVILIVLVILVTIYNRMRLNELTNEIENTKLTYQNLLAEKKTIELKLSEKYSDDEIKLRAEALGMVKAQAKQVTYVDIVVSEDIVTNPKSPDTVREAAFSLFDFLK